MGGIIRVLYVDDEPDLLEIGKVFLEESGDFTVTTALSAVEALRLLELEKFKAIISDYQMPGMDGIQFLVEVRKRFGQVPFILFTGKGREEVVIQAINSGADFYLQKGGDPNAQFAELVHKIKQAAMRNKAEDSLRKSEEKYRQLIEHSNEAILVAQDGILKLVNHRLIELLGYSEQELLSTPFPVLIDPDDRDMVVERYQKRLKGEEFPSRYAFRLNPKDGNILWVEISVVVIDWDGRPATLNFLTDITERKRAEEALLESRDRSDGILASLDEAILLVDPVTRLISMCNNATTRIFGYSQEELVGRATNLLHVDQAHFEQFGRDALIAYENPGYFATEFEMRRKDGSVFPSEHFVRPIRDTDGRPKYVVSVVRDITERMQAEKTLHEAQIRTATILEGIADTFYSLDDTWRFTTVNPAAEKAPFGRQASEMLGKVIWELYPGLIGTFIQEHYFAAAKNFSLEHYEGQSPLNGRWYEVFMQGRKSGVDVYMRDISERKLAEKTLSESEEKYRLLIDQTDEGVWVIDQDYRTTFVNNRLASMFGYSPGEMLGKAVREFMPVEDMPVHNQRMRERLAGKRDRFEQRFIRKDGSAFWVIASVTPFVSENNVSGAFAMLSDITERKRAEEELRHLMEFQGGVITNARVWLSVLDFTGRILLWNTGAEELSGYTSDEVVGQKEIWKKIYPDPEYRKQVTNTITRIIRDNNYLENFETTIISKKGEKRVISWNTKGIPDATGVVSAYIAIGVDVTERKRAEEELRFHAEIERNMSDAVYLIRVSDGIIVYSNPSFEKLFRYDYGELIGKHVSVVNAPTGKAPGEVADEIMNSLSTSGTWSGEVLNIRKDGTTFWSFANVITFEHPRFGKVWLSMHRDITERKWVEEALVKSEARHRTILQTTTDGFYMINAEGNVTDVNDTYCRMSGYTRTELLKLGIADLDAIEGPAETEERIRRIITNGSEIFETCHRRKDGSVFDVELSVTYQNVDGGQFISFCRDITARKRAEETLALKTSQMTLAQQMAKVGYWSFDIADGIPVWSDMMFEVFGRDPAISVPHYANHRDFIHPDDWAIFDDAVKGAVKGIPYNIIIRVIFPDGSIHFVTTQGYPQRDSRGKIASLFGTSQDITDRKRAEQALQEANKKLNLLSGITRHDINNQLLVLNGFLKLLQKQATDPAFDDFFTRITKASGRISSMIRFTKEYEQIGVNAPVWQDCRKLIETAASEAPLGKVRVKNDLPVGLEVFADPLIVKVCYNLMENAVRYGEKITTIRFSAEKYYGDLVIVCEDDGVGISEDEKGQIFKRGFGKNTGMGLFLSSEILSITGITMTENGEPGKGARFVMTVPKGMWRVKPGE